MPERMGKKHQIQQSINKINPIAEHVSYSYEMVMKPPLATKMWRDTVGFGSIPTASAPLDVGFGLHFLAVSMYSSK